MLPPLCLPSPWPFTASVPLLVCYGGLLALVSLVCGGFLGWFIARYRALGRLARLEAEIQAAAEARALLQRHYEESRQDMQARFQSLAAEALDLSATHLKEHNEAQLSAILAPLREQLLALGQAVQDTRSSGASHSAALQQMVRLLMERAEAIGQDAANLTRALKGDSKVQGDWGEMVLEKLLEDSGLVRGEHFSVQPSYTAADGSRLRPDVVVHFPQDRHIIIDSKVSLTAYTEYMAADSDAARALALKRHIASVRNHIKELAAKHYEKLERESPDDVLMFIPHEGAYAIAIQQAPALATEAVQNKVLLISPANLVMALQLARFLWQKDAQQRNVQAIVERATLLYEKFVRVQQSFDAIETALQSAVAAYGETRKLLYSGKGNYISQVEKLRQLGLSPDRKLRTE